MALIQQVKIDDGTVNNIASTAFGQCTTAADEVVKTVDMPGFTLIEGTTIYVYFPNGSTSFATSLNVNNTGAKTIVQYPDWPLAAFPEESFFSLTYVNNQWLLQSPLDFNLAAGRKGTPIYIDDQGLSHEISYLNVTPKLTAGHITVPFFHNNLAHLIRRGGTCEVYAVPTSSDITSTTLSSNSTAVTQVQNSPGIESLFTLDSEMVSFSIANPFSPLVVIFDVTLPEPQYISQETIYYIDFGNTSGPSPTNSMLLGKTPSGTSYNMLGGNNGYLEAFTNESIVGIIYAYAANVTVDKLRFLLTYENVDTSGPIELDFNAIGLDSQVGSSPRLGYMSRGCDDDVWRSINPAASTYTLGTTAKRWDTVNANAFNNLLIGTGIVGEDKGSGQSPQYIPSKWTFDIGRNVNDGDIFLIKTPVAGHSYGVYISIDGGDNYYPVVLGSTTKLTTHYPAGVYLQVVFESTGSAASITPAVGANSANGSTVSGGAFRVVNFYDSNSTTISNLNAAYGHYIAANQIYRYQLLFQTDEDHLCALTSTNNSTATSKVMLTDQQFLMDGLIFYYPSTTDAAINTNIAAGSLLFSYPMDLRYTFNTGTTLTSNKNVYLKVTQVNGRLCKMAPTNPIVQTLPSTDDGFYYILLGRSYSSYQIMLYRDHPIYRYTDQLYQVQTSTKFAGKTEFTELVCTDKGANQHIRFTRASADGGPSYITYPELGSLALGVSTGYDNTLLLLDGRTSVRPGKNNTYNLGSSDYYWKNTYTGTLTIKSTDSTRHLQFSRASCNYIIAPTGGSFDFRIAGDSAGMSAAACTLHITANEITGGATNAFNLGHNDLRWKSLYLQTSLLVGPVGYTAGTTDMTNDGAIITPKYIMLTKNSVPGSSETSGFFIYNKGRPVARMYLYVNGTASTETGVDENNNPIYTSAIGEARLYLGNASIGVDNGAGSVEGNAAGVLVLYGAGARCTYLKSNPASGSYSRTVYLPHYDGTMHLIHASSTEAVGSKTQPIYADVNGRIKVANFMLSVFNSNFSDSAIDQSFGVYKIANVAVSSISGSTKLFGNALVLNGDSTTNMRYRSEMVIASLTGDTPTHIYTRRLLDGDPDTWSTWTTILDDGNYGTILNSVYVSRIANSTDNAIARFNGTAGAIQNSGVTINDSNCITVPHTANTNGELKITYSDTVSFWIGVGIGNVNHGLYDDKKGSSGTWILSTGADHNWKFNGTASAADKLTGFSAYSSDMSWSNQTGTSITCLRSTGGGALGFRDNNPSSGKMSMVIDGTVYINEGANNVGDAIKSLTISNATVSYTNVWGSTGTAFTIPTSAGTSTLAWDTEVTLGTIAGLAIKAKLPVNPNTNTDTLVIQNAKTDNAAYKVLMTNTTSVTSGNAAEVGYCTNFQINPSKCLVTIQRTSGTGDTGFIAENTTTPLKIGYIISNGGNGGIYDYTNGEWKLQIKSDGTTTLSGNATSASTVAATLNQVTKTYLLGTSTQIASTAENVSLSGDTGVYLTQTAGELSATRYSWNYSAAEKVYTVWNNADQSIDFIFA